MSKVSKLCKLVQNADILFKMAVEFWAEEQGLERKRG